MVIARGIAGLGFALAVVSAASATPTFPANATGDWRGMVQAKDAPRHLFVHIHKTRAGEYVATLYSPEDKAGDMVARPLEAPEGVLAFAADGGQFRGDWNDARGRWEGTWTQSGASAPLVLTLNDDSTAVRAERLQSLEDTMKSIPPRPAIPPEFVPPSAR